MVTLFPYSSLSILGHVLKYQKLGIIHTFVHSILLAQGGSVVKLKHWYFFLVSGKFHHESIVLVIMSHGNRISFTILAAARVEILGGNLKF